MTDGRDDELYADRAYRPGPPPELREPPRRRSRALGIFVATFALAAFAGVVWYAYDQGLRRGSEETAPLIKADSRPTKVRPEQPGGLQVPNQDKLVYDAMRPGGAADTPRVERLLPPPETPVERPAPPPPPPLPQSTPPAAAAPSAEATVPPVEPRPAPPPSASDAGIPPARIVTPAPTHQVPKPEDPASAAPLAPPAPPPPAPAPAPAAAPAPPLAAPVPAAPAPAAPEPEAKPEPKPVQTAAVPAAGNFRVQVGALRDEAAAAAEWTRLKKRHPDELGTLAHRVQRIDLGAGKGIFFRIQSSGVSEASAEAICAALKAKSQPCIVVRP